MIPGFHVGAMLLHDQATAIVEVARLGFRCVAIRPRAGSLDPAQSWFSQQVVCLADAIDRAQVRVVIDADTWFMPDPRAPRGPSLLSHSQTQAAAARDGIQRWIELAGELGSDLITFSSGRSDAVATESPGGEPAWETMTAEGTLERIAEQLSRLASMAQRHGVRLALRPRSGDAIATVAQFERLAQWLDQPQSILLAADVGEMLLGHEIPVSDRLIRNLDSLACVYLCDHRSGSAGDQRIGQGEVALSRITSALAANGFDGPAIVRVEGHSQHGFDLAQESLAAFPGQK
jgi:sugar phosphate isomerase/epimerase